jgi:hypothetical protein
MPTLTGIWFRPAMWRYLETNGVLIVMLTKLPLIWIAPIVTWRMWTVFGWFGSPSPLTNAASRSVTKPGAIDSTGVAPDTFA